MARPSERASALRPGPLFRGRDAEVAVGRSVPTGWLQSMEAESWDVPRGGLQCRRPLAAGWGTAPAQMNARSSPDKLRRCLLDLQSRWETLRESVRRSSPAPSE